MSLYYRKVFPRLFQNVHWQQLDAPGKLIALYLIAGPQCNRVGLYPFSMALAADQCGIPLVEYKPKLAHVLDAFNWRYDERAHVLWVPTWLVWNNVETLNQLKSVAKDLDDVPSGTVFLQPLLQLLDRIPDSLPTYQRDAALAFLVDLRARFASSPRTN